MRWVTGTLPTLPRADPPADLTTISLTCNVDGVPAARPNRACPTASHAADSYRVIANAGRTLPQVEQRAFEDALLDGRTHTLQQKSPDPVR